MDWNGYNGNGMDWNGNGMDWNGNGYNGNGNGNGWTGNGYADDDDWPAAGPAWAPADPDPRRRRRHRRWSPDHGWGGGWPIDKCPPRPPWDWRRGGPDPWEK